MTAPDSDRQEALADPRDELLVAYLDGQLASEECERIEAALSADHATRERLQTFDRVWNALDALPRTTASPAFTKSTVEMAAVAKEKPEVGSFRRWLPPVWVGVACAGVFLGAVLTVWAADAPQRRALGELAAAMNTPALEAIGSLEFARSLANELRDELAPFRTPAVETAADDWETVAGASLPARRAWVAELSPSRLAEANDRVAKFEALSRERQSALRDLAREIDQSPNAQELRAVVLAYHAAVDRLPASEQATLREMSVHNRARAIRRRAGDWAMEQQLDLSSADRAALRDAIESLTRSDAYREDTDRVVEALKERIGNRANERFALRVVENLRRELRRRPELLMLGATERFAVGRAPIDRAPGLFRVFADFMKPNDTITATLAVAWKRWTAELEPALSASARSALSELKSVRERARAFGKLFRQTYQEEDLAAVFVGVDAEELDELLLLPGDEFVDALTDRSSGDFVLPPFPSMGGRGEGPRAGGFSDRSERRPPRGGERTQWRDGGPPPRRFGPPPGEPPPRPLRSR